MLRQAAKTLLVPALACASVACAQPREACSAGPADAARVNAVGVAYLAVAPFRRAETGWAVYETLVAHEISTNCPAASPGFAAALHRWQTTRGMAADGRMSSAVLSTMAARWQTRRPFVTQSRRSCPAPPSSSGLTTASPSESYGGKTIQLTPTAMAAYRRMRAAFRTEQPAAARDRDALTIFSAFRSPEYDDARCARDLNCNGVVRARCSAHRTGMALDLNVGAAPGFGPDDSTDINRLFMTRTAAYRWLVKNAHRFGFANYPFEPWHWEYVGR